MPQTLSYEQIAAALLEGPPLVMLDSLELDAEAGTATGTKAVSMAEPFFQGHFPGAPIMPGVLQVGAMVQAASLLASEGGDVSVRMVAMERVKFRKPVMPGDVMTVEVTAAPAAEDGSLRFEGKTLCGGDTACSARFVLAAVPIGTPTDMPIPEGEAKETLDTMAITKVIPHRFPFLLVDAADVYDGWMMGHKNVSGGDALLAGAKCTSFFEYLMVEAAAQTACVEALSLPESQGKLGYFMSIDKAEFFRQAKPGDRLEMQVAMNMRGRFGVAEATGRVDGDIVFQAAMKFALVDREQEQV